MKKHLRFTIGLIAVLLLGIAPACKNTSDKPLTLVAADCGWDSQKFHNELAKIVIENAYQGYRLDTSTASSIMNWESMKKGDVDLFIEVWPNTVQSFTQDVESGEVIIHGILVPGSRSGVYVLRYVVEGDPARGIAPVLPNLKRVDQLINYPHIFPDDENPSRGRFYGAIPGWRIDEILFKKYEHYGLDKNFNYIRLGSEAAIFAALMSAYNLGKPWVGYCYEPTWIAGKVPLILLEEAPYDPVGYYEGTTAFASQLLQTVSSSQFPAKAPDLLPFLKKFETGTGFISEALAYLDDTKASHEDAAVWFLKNHDNLIDEWLPATNARRLREHLSKR